jgi:tryptophan-rich sensory protein
MIPQQLAGHVSISMIFTSLFSHRRVVGMVRRERQLGNHSSSAGFEHRNPMSSRPGCEAASGWNDRGPAAGADRAEWLTHFGLIMNTAVTASSPLWKPIILAGVAVAAVAVLGATQTDLGPWYQGLVKPPWQPPNWLFGPVWTAIYVLTTISIVVAWRSAADRRQRSRIIVGFGINLILNLLWTILFFRLHRPDWALVDIALLWLSIVVLIVILSRFAGFAAWLLVPYLAWVSFAAALNLAIFTLNASNASL